MQLSPSLGRELFFLKQRSHLVPILPARVRSWLDTEVNTHFFKIPALVIHTRTVLVLKYRGVKAYAKSHLRYPL